jgi:hypothetical protein
MSGLVGSRYRQRVLDALLVLALAGVGAMVGSSYYTAATARVKAEFYQTEFAPAVMEACGRGFVNPVPGSVPVMAQFITQERTTLDCAELPANITLQPLNKFQVAFRYLMFVVSTYWRATGVSWDHLAPFFGALHGIVVGLGYLALRVVLTRTLAVPLGLAIAFSPAQLSILPYLRDSAKTPFFMADALLVLLVWTRALTTRTVVVLCALFGATAGIGVGFRPDVVMWFPMLAVALLLAQHASLRRRITATALGLAVSVGALGVFGWPILAQYKSQNNFGHVALLGFAKEFDDRLGVRAGPYTIDPFYNDAYINAVVNSYAKRVYGVTGHMRLSNPAYGRYASMYYWEIVRTFSADVATRLGASVVHVLNLPFRRQEYESDPAVQSVSALHGIVQARRQILGALDGWGPYLVLLVVLMFAARSIALACGFAITVLYLAGLPVVQFHLRHYSHLELVGLFALGIVVQSVARCVPASARATLQERWTWPSLRPRVVRVGVCLAAIVLIPLISVCVLRWCQESVLNRLIASYNLAAAEDVPYSIRPEDPNHVVVVPAGVPVIERVRTPGMPQVYDDYLVIDVGHGCDSMSLTMRIIYESATGASGYSRDVPVKLWPTRKYGTVRVFAPIYQYVVDGITVPDQGIRFQGFEFLTRDLSCLSGLKRVPDSSRTPLWLDLSLSRTWEDERLYQTLADTAAVSSPDPVIYRSSPELVVSRRAVDALHGVARDFNSVSKVARVDGSVGASVEGVAEAAFAYLVMSKPKAVAAGTQVLAVGELFDGGFTLGLQKDGQWSQTLNVTRPGLFLAAVDVPADGTYVAVIANVNPDPAGRTRFVITGLDWAAPAVSRGPAR